jgi:hypothetical protein
MATKTWNEKLNCDKEAQIKVLSHSFGEMREGDKMLIPSPLLIKEYMESIPQGNQKSIAEMRKELAFQFKADGTCHLTTGIFCRIVAEAALEDLALGQNKITPFWRVISSKDKISKKLSCGIDFINTYRQKEDL